MRISKMFLNLLALFSILGLVLAADPTGQPTGQPSRQPSRQPTAQPTGQPSVGIKQVITSAPTTAGDIFFMATISVKLSGLAMMDVTDTLKLSLRKAAAVTLGTSLDGIGEPTFAESARRRLVSGLTVSFTAVVTGANQASVLSSAQQSFATSGTTFASLVVAYAAAAGQTVTVTYVGVEIKVETIKSSYPTPSPTVLAPGATAGIVIAVVFAAGTIATTVFVAYYHPEWLGFKVPEMPTEPSAYYPEEQLTTKPSAENHPLDTKSIPLTEVQVDVIPVKQHQVAI